MTNVPQNYIEAAKGFFDVVQAFDRIDITYFLEIAWTIGRITEGRRMAIIENMNEHGPDSIQFYATLLPEEIALLMYHRLEPKKAVEP